MTRILLVRHAPTAETGDRLTGRLPGVSLGEAGEVIAQRTAERLAGLNLAAIYASPIERTWETATAIANHHRCRPIPHDGLLEVDYGAWSGRTLKSLYPLKAWKVVQTTPSRMIFPSGESLLDAQCRAVATCEDIARRHPGKIVVAVTHADIIKAALSHFLGQTLDLFNRIGVDPGSVSVLDLPTTGSPRIIAINTDGSHPSWH